MHKLSGDLTAEHGLISMLIWMNYPEYNWLGIMVNAKCKTIKIYSWES